MEQIGEVYDRLELSTLQTAIKEQKGKATFKLGVTFYENIAKLRALRTVRPELEIRAVIAGTFCRIGRC